MGVFGDVANDWTAQPVVDTRGNSDITAVLYLDGGAFYCDLPPASRDGVRALLRANAGTAAQ